MPRRDPFREIEELFERMGQEFEDLGGGLDSAVSGDVNVDVAEDTENVIVTADLPGYDRDDIEVEARDDALVIAATHTESTETEDDGEETHYHRRERRKRSVSRRVKLPAPVTPGEASAEYTNGVLTVTLPKRTPEKGGGHSIDVS